MSAKSLTSYTDETEVALNRTNPQTTTIERRYDSQEDRLFLVYYALPPGFNANKWGVSHRSLDANIQTAINKPVIIYRKNPGLSFHTHQAGNFVHPTIEEARAELGHSPNEKEYYQWQEKFAVGRIRQVDKRNKGYAFTLEITDPDAKQILTKSDRYSRGIPGWTSPQILTNGKIYPNEELSGVFDHWTISHVILTDSPAYGFDKSSLSAKCLGPEQTCMIQTKNASQENLGFCIKQATMDLVESRKGRDTIVENLHTLSANFDSSHIALDSNPSHTIMSTSETPTPSETVVTKTMTDNNTNTTQPSQPVSQQQQQPMISQPEPSKEEDPNKPKEGEEPSKEEVKVSSIEEANATIGQMSSLIKDLQKTVKTQGKELETIKTERKMARLSFIIPRDLFKSDESHLKEVQKTMNENVSEQWLIEFWKTKRELAMMQHGQVNKMEQPLIAKSASINVQHEVPEYGSSNKTTQRSNVEKQLELQRMIIEGGA